jgi:nucleoside-diphosphate-sugar epimerase
VTGGRGYIGAALAQALTPIACRLVLVDRSPERDWRPDPGLARCSVVNRDLSDPGAWETLLRGADCVFHLAGTEYVRAPDADPLLDFQSNALPGIRLVEVGRALGVRPRIVCASSVNVVGLADLLPVGEQHRERPLIPWAVHKLLAEHYLRIYADRHGIPSLSLRLSNVYGPSPRRAVDERVAFNRMIGDAAAGRPLRVYGNAACIRDYVFIDDVVDALLRAGAVPEHADGDVYMVGSGVGTSITTACTVIAQAVLARTGRTVEIRHEHHSAIPGDRFEMRDFVADITRFSADTGWVARVSLECGVGVMIERCLAAPAADGTPYGVAP